MSPVRPERFSATVVEPCTSGPTSALSVAPADRHATVLLLEGVVRAFCLEAEETEDETVHRRLSFLAADCLDAIEELQA